MTEPARPLRSAARRIAASSPAAGAISTTCACPTCSTPRSSGALTPTRVSPRVDAAPARAVPGVIAVLSGADLPECEAAIPPFIPSPNLRPYPHPAIAREVARHAGEAVAVVLADDRYRAADAALAVSVATRSCPPPPTSTRRSLPARRACSRSGPTTSPALPQGAVGSVEAGFAEAQVIVEARLTFPRVAPVPLEPRGVLAWPSAHDGRLTVWSSTQVPYAVRTAIAGALGLPEEHVRILAPDVGGGFGGKGHAYPEEVLIAAVARRVGRPVKWVETRTEHFLAASPDRDQRHVARLGVRADGTIAALETAFTRDHGAYPTLGEVMPQNTINHLPGPYRVPHYRAAATGVVTHKTFSGAYRGAGRPEAAFVLDRLLDRAARRLGMDPVELRRRNIIRAGEMPYPTGLTYRDGAVITYDPADYAAGFDLALSRLGYAEWRAEQQRRRGTTRPLGLGVSAYVEGTGIGPFEGADVRIDPSGTVYLFVGVACQGQAHETTLAQICAAELGVEIDQVSVVGGDTSVIPHGMGTIASRVAAVAGPAVARSSREVARRARLVAAETLECAADDVVLAGGPRPRGRRSLARCRPRRPRPRRRAQRRPRPRGRRTRAPRLRLLLPGFRHLGLRRPRLRGGGRRGDGRRARRCATWPSTIAGAPSIPWSSRASSTAASRRAWARALLRGADPRRARPAPDRLADGLRAAARRRHSAPGGRRRSTTRPPSTTSASRAWARAASSHRRWPSPTPWRTP